MIARRGGVGEFSVRCDAPNCGELLFASSVETAVGELIAVAGLAGWTEEYTDWGWVDRCPAHSAAKKGE